MDIFKKLSIALEAEGDDITKETEDDRSNLNQPPDDDSGEEDYIFGGDENEEVEDEENPPVDEEIDNDEIDDDSQQDEGGGDYDFGDDSGENEEELPEIERKIKLRENMVLLHSILSSNLKLLNDYTPDISNDDLSKVLFNISSVLGESKDILFDEIVNGFKKKSYTSLLRTYVSINRVFELTQKTLEKYFENIDLLKNETRKKNTKHNS